MWPVLAQVETSTSGGWRQTIDTIARTPLSQIVIFVSVCSVIRIALYAYLRNTVPHRRHGAYVFAKFFNEAMDALIYAGVFVFMIIRPFFLQAFLIPTGSMLQTLYLNDYIVANKLIYRYSEPQVGDIIVFKPPKHALDPSQGDQDYIKRLIGKPGDLIEVRAGKLYRNGEAINETFLSNSPGDTTSANGNPVETGADTKMSYDWKLVHYTGTTRPNLQNQYVPVQIHRGDEDAPVNYEVPIAPLFAVGEAGDPDPHGGNVRGFKGRDMLSDRDWRFSNELRSAPPSKIPDGYYLFMGDNRNNSYDGRCWGLVPREDIIGRSEFIWLPISRWRITR